MIWPFSLLSKKRRQQQPPEPPSLIVLADEMRAIAQAYPYIQSTDAPYPAHQCTRQITWEGQIIDVTFTYDSVPVPSSKERMWVWHLSISPHDRRLSDEQVLRWLGSFFDSGENVHEISQPVQSSLGIVGLVLRVMNQRQFVQPVRNPCCTRPTSPV